MALKLAKKMAAHREFVTPAGQVSTCGRVSIDGTYFVVGTSEGTVRVHEIHSSRVVFTYTPVVPKGEAKPSVTALRFRPAGPGEAQNVLAIASSDGQARRGGGSRGAARRAGWGLC